MLKSLYGSLWFSVI